MNRIMVTNFFLAFLLVITGSMHVNAQKSSQPAVSNKAKPSTATRGFTLHLGPSVTYYQGGSTRSFDTFETDRLSWQVNGMLGYGFNKNNANRSNILGIFGTGGYTTQRVLNQMLTDQSLVVADLATSKYYNFYQVEGGMLIAEILRLSTGVGVQHYATTSTGDEQLYYVSSTAGLSFALGSSVNWVFDVNFIHGRDFNNTVIRASTGLSIAF
ncbi:MAG: hypothetical protein JNM78_03970 [Cyclobacteriaceae bacterium]|nr:hypothetical protein [Cyclobacteriaceae bacterium]